MPSKYRNVLGYFLSSAISKLLAFLLLPFITYNISPEEFGTWAIFNTTILILVPFSGSVLRNALARSYYSSNKEELGQKVWTILLLNFSLSTLVSLIMLVTSQYVESLFGLDIKFYYFIPILLMLNNIKEMGLLVMRYENNVMSYVKNELGQGVLNALLILVLFLFVWVDWQILLVAYSISLLFSALHSSIFIKNKISTSISASIPFVKDCMTVGIHLLPHALSTVVIGFSDRFIIESKLGLEAVGLYSVAASLSAVIIMFTNAYNKVWGPWVTKKMTEGFTKEAKLLCVNYTYKFLAAIVIYSSCAVIMIRLIVLQVMPEIYHQSLMVFIWITVGFIFQGLYFSLFHYLNFIKRTKVFLIATTISALVNVVLNLVLVGPYGITGAGMATALAYFVLFVLVFIYNQILNPMPWLRGSEN